MTLPSNKPWQPPTYEEAYVRDGQMDYLCTRCSAFVTDIIVHNRHHRALDQLRDGLVALTQILIPNLPSDTLLSAIGTATNVGAMINEMAPDLQDNEE